MEKKFKFKDKPKTVKLIYAAVIAILCITAIVIGIVSAASGKDDGDKLPPDLSGENQGQTPPEETPPEDKGEEEKKELTFVMPTSGEIVKEHSLDAPVFWPTLGEWKVHTGIDISTEEGAAVYASEDGIVSGLYSDPMLGFTVEITHEGDVKTRYSNLSKEDSATLKVGDSVKEGDKIGTVGDTTVSELAEEPHLHFEMLVGGVKVNPKDYLPKTSD